MRHCLLQTSVGVTYPITYCGVDVRRDAEFAGIVTWVGLDGFEDVTCRDCLANHAAHVMLEARSRDCLAKDERLREVQAKAGLSRPLFPLQPTARCADCGYDRFRAYDCTYCGRRRQRGDGPPLVQKGTRS